MNLFSVFRGCKDGITPQVQRTIWKMKIAVEQRRCMQCHFSAATISNYCSCVKESTVDHDPAKDLEFLQSLLVAWGTVMSGHDYNRLDASNWLHRDKAFLLGWLVKEESKKGKLSTKNIEARNNFPRRHSASSVSIVIIILSDRNSGASWEDDVSLTGNTNGSSQIKGPAYFCVFYARLWLPTEWSAHWNMLQLSFLFCCSLSFFINCQSVADAMQITTYG